MIEPPIFLRRLELDLRLAGVRFVRRTFATLEEITTLEQSLVVNCLGLGARTVCGDNNVVPIRGLLALLRPQTHLDYLFSAARGYVFPRSDAVVVGGTFEEGEERLDPDPAQYREMVSIAASAFNSEDLKRNLPNWFYSQS